MQLQSDGASGQGACCGSLIFLIPLCVAAGRFNGDDYSSLWIIFPLLFAGGMILCCLGCCIFGAGEEDANRMQEAMEAEEGKMRVQRGGGSNDYASNYTPPTGAEPKTPTQAAAAPVPAAPAPAPAPVSADILGLEKVTVDVTKENRGISADSDGLD